MVRHILSHHVCTFLYAILGSVIEKTFIAKIHKALSKEIYRWKINDAYHGGVPDVYYSGLAGCMFVEYKYHRKIPVKATSKISINTSTQQKEWLKRAISHSVPAYVVVGAADKIVMTQDIDKTFFTVKEFLEQALSFNEYIDKLTRVLTTGG